MSEPVIPKTMIELFAWLRAHECTITPLGDQHRQTNNSTATHEVRRRRFCGRYNFPPDADPTWIERVCALVVEDVEDYIRG